MADPRGTLYRFMDQGGLWRQTIELKRGQPLNLAGSLERDTYYVESGTLITTVEIGGEEQCIRFGYPGDFLTNIDTYISQEPTRFTTVALRK